ncbi:hypothetical protein MTO96_016751 [Rhipicephalus appendiculatus]
MSAAAFSVRRCSLRVRELQAIQQQGCGMTFSNFRATLPGRACISGAAPVPARAIDAGTWPATAARLWELLDEHAVFSPATARRPGERRIELAGGSGALFRAVRGSERTHTHAGGRPALPWRGYPMPPPVAASLGSWGRLRRGTRRSSTGQARLSIVGGRSHADGDGGAGGGGAVVGRGSRHGGGLLGWWAAACDSSA